MTQLTDKERKEQMAEMKSFDEQMPCVGIFWYDPETHSLFGVQKEEVTPQKVEREAVNAFESSVILERRKIRILSPKDVSFGILISSSSSSESGRSPSRRN